MLRSRFIVISTHILGWLICISLPWLFNGHTGNSQLLAFALCIVLSVLIEIIHHRWEASNNALHAEASKTRAELSFLKSQLHPHFFFNTLNNIYSLAVSGHEHTARHILKLSNMMRYATDTHHDFVLLQQEIACLHDYIDLQQLRLPGSTQVHFSVSGNPGFKYIAPLLLLPFLENAFRHGVSAMQTTAIHIHLSTTTDHIRFYCSNRLFSHPEDDSTTDALLLTRQRLQQLYPDKYQLTISNKNSEYAVRLEICI
ncbi:sensor histidine kinase [Chitinophaga sp. Mgbs1]|uniref:Sensor histidine kinase n=1 Tax=Chitinophaga solisilvae TaxID=1233460 RepID=A0A9Q5DF38_9BACT|nr:sensor histidine kinase [Chitinophaga solisilvae]